MKSVTHIITTIERGGAENQLIVLVREQVKCGYQVKIIYIKGKPELADEFRSLGAEVESRLHSKNIISQLILLSRLIKNFNGTIHAHLPRAEIMSAIVVRGKKIIVSRHNTEQFFPFAPKLVSILLSRYVESKTFVIVAISDAVKNFLLETGEIRNKEKIKVVYYSCNSEIRQKRRSVTKSHSSYFTIGTVARLTPQKDIPTLLIAFQRFKLKYPDTRLLIVGTGILEEELKKFSVQLELSDSITWIGKTDNIWQTMAKMDLFVLPSKYEGFGLVLLEAIQAGVGVIAARNSAIPEVLGHNSDGLFTTGDANDLFQKLMKFYKSKNRKHLIRAQRSRLNLFNPSLMIGEMNLVYESVTQKL